MQYQQQATAGQAPTPSDQKRLRDKIGYFNKNVDNVLVNNPDPASSHFQQSNDRFVRDFAAVEKAEREQRNKIKQ